MDTYRGEDIHRIAIIGDDISVLFMRDESVFIVSIPDMNIIWYGTQDDVLDADEKFAAWLTMVYFLLSEPAKARSCPSDCPCRNGNPQAVGDILTFTRKRT
jgi:hypothetical protein